MEKNNLTIKTVWGFNLPWQAFFLYTHWWHMCCCRCGDWELQAAQPVAADLGCGMGTLPTGPGFASCWRKMPGLGFCAAWALCCRRHGRKQQLLGWGCLGRCSLAGPGRVWVVSRQSYLEQGHCYSKMCGTEGSFCCYPCDFCLAGSLAEIL